MVPMNKVRFAITVFLTALFLQLFFLCCMRTEYHAITMAHGNLAFNVYRYTIPALSCSLTHTMHALQNGKAQLIEYAVVRNDDFGKPAIPFPVNDTIGYGLLLGILWKCSHSLLFMDVIVLQIMIYLIMFLLFYKSVQWLCDESTARYATIAFLFYMPLVALNVHAVRDVWAAYGAITLLFAVIGYINNRFSWILLLPCLLWISICLWIRPSLFLAMIIFSVILMMNAIMHHKSRKKSITMVIFLWTTTGISFWLPLFYFNTVTYDRLFVGPVGQDLLEGLGEFENPWEHQLSDEYVAQLIHKKYGYLYGTPAFDDAAKKEFDRAYQEQPSLFWKHMIQRIPMLIMPALPWIFYEESPYCGLTTKDKIQRLISSPWLWLDGIARYLFIWMYLLMGYAGLILLCKHKKWMPFIYIIALLCASWAKLPSHIEYRYLTPYYWVLCISIGYLVATIKKRGAHCAPL